MKCTSCYRIFVKGSFCKKCNNLICPECRMRFNGNIYCKDCYVDTFAYELINDISEAIGINDLIKMWENKEVELQKQEVTSSKLL